MKIYGKLEEILHVFDAMKGECEGCPARLRCSQQDKAEEWVGLNENRRSSCKDMLASVVEVQLQPKYTPPLYAGGEAVEGVEET